MRARRLENWRQQPAHLVQIVCSLENTFDRTVIELGERRVLVAQLLQPLIARRAMGLLEHLGALLADVPFLLGLLVAGLIEIEVPVVVRAALFALARVFDLICAARIAAYLEAGCSKFVLRPACPPEQIPAQLDLIAREIAPRFDRTMVPA